MPTCKEFLRLPDTLTAERPNHGPTQILNPEEIKPGDVLIKHLRACYDPSIEEFTVLCAPFQEDGSWKMKVRCMIGDANFRLSDCGVVPYPYIYGGTVFWNRYNWLEKKQ